MKCFKCGAKLEADSKLCPKCGEPQGFSLNLIENAKNGNQNAITELYNRTYNNVYFTVKALIKSEDTILDIVQDSYVKGFKNLSQLQDPDKFRAWIKRIAHNSAVDYLRKTKPVMFSTMSTEDDSFIEFEDDRTENLPEVVIDQKETTRLVKEILDSLSDEQRLVVGMFYYEQMSVKEIAQTLGISENTVKSRLSYGRKKIEMQVKELEKKGTKLYSLAPLPFLLLLFKNMDAQAMEIPNTAVLQSIQQECTAVSGVGGTNTENVLKASTKSAVKTAGGTAAKGIAAKIIAGITAAVIIGTTVGIVALNQKEEPQQETQQITQETQQITQETQEVTENEIKLSPEEIYKPILDEYSLAMGADHNDETAEFPNINYVMMNYYYQYGGYDGTYFTGFYYDYYDIDGNGTDELLIGYGSKFKDVVDVYGTKDNKPQKLIDEYSLGERSQLYIYPDGTMLLFGSGGAELNVIDTYKIKEDGVSLSVESETYEGAFNLDSALAEKSNNQEAVEDFGWKPIDTKWDTESSGNSEEYIGQYINGNDWNAGIITIEANDSDSVKVRLEAFRNRSDQELSIIFEGTGYAVADGLVVDVSGKQVKLIKKDIGFILDAAPSLKMEWDLDPYIYTGEYVSIMPMEDDSYF
ncbi:MAG TPA: sigma-70 family RNA polymerase sigma factor [Candidatus Limousia pullorum]|uniref:RNA polymerase sigma factor n=1 Tax=Candidatus Limousia pullorum TaxID=2840860 RepID=A0A9D1LYK5_9FIRM|nr:sigma-70 family RNA polymerase sigma factor [Candidatus Limousia pullorum]